MDMLDSPPATAATKLAHISPGNIRSLILEKEKELHDINEYRIHTLEALLRDKEIAVNTYKQKFAKLQEDFKYNLKLLEGRDEELALYDTNFASLKGVLRDREVEVSELKAQVADLQAEMKQAKAREQDQEAFLHQKLKDARAQMEGARWKFDEELRRQKDEMDQHRRKMERQLREKDEDLDTQRREITITFDEIMRHRETEFKETMEQLQAKNREMELQQKSLQREYDTSKVRNEELKLKLENMQQLLSDNEKEIKALEWQLADVRSSKDARINDLEDEMVKLHEVKQALLDEYEGKMAELLQSLHSVEKAFVQQKNHYEEELHRHLKRKEDDGKAIATKLDAKIATLATKLREAEEKYEQTQAELKQAKWEADDKIIEKEREIERIKGELQDIEDEKQTLAGEIRQQLYEKDRAMLALQEKLKDVNLQLQMHKEKEKVHRQELIESMEKQEDLKREIVTLNLRWENKWQDHEQEMAGHHELRMRELKQSKNRLEVEKQAIEERLVHAENELQRLQSELHSLKSNARIAESFGSQYYARKATKNNGSSREGHLSDGNKSADAPSTGVDLPAPSPLWSEDNGTLSPIAGMSPLFTDSPQRDGVRVAPLTTSGEDKTQQTLQAENAKLRDLIHQMKEALAQQAHEASNENGLSESVDKNLAIRLQEAQSRCASLEAKLAQLQANPASMLDSEQSDETVASCREQLDAANRVIEAKTQRITELEAQVSDLKQQLGETSYNDKALQASQVMADAQLSDLRQKLAAAHNDIDRLVRERSQLMELSNQLRADLRKLQDTTGSRRGSGQNQTPTRADFAEKKDYENLIAELTRSLEESRIHNKTLKKELRRIVKFQVLQQATHEGDDNSIPNTQQRRRLTSVSSSAADGSEADVNSGRRRSSTLSMMKTLEMDNRDKTKRTSIASSVSNSGDLDEDLLSLARNKLPTAAQSPALKNHVSAERVQSSGSKNGLPTSIPEDTNESDSDGSERDDEEKSDKTHITKHNAGTASGPGSTISTLFQRDRLDSTMSSDSTSAKVSDARLKLQQDILIISPHSLSPSLLQHSFLGIPLTYTYQRKC